MYNYVAVQNLMVKQQALVIVQTKHVQVGIVKFHQSEALRRRGAQWVM